MNQVIEIFNKYKTYIVRGVVGAFLASVLWGVGMPIWLNGAIIALVTGIVGDFLTPYLDQSIAKISEKSSKKDASAE